MVCDKKIMEIVRFFNARPRFYEGFPLICNQGVTSSNLVAGTMFMIPPPPLTLPPVRRNGMGIDFNLLFAGFLGLLLALRPPFWRGAFQR